MQNKVSLHICVSWPDSILIVSKIDNGQCGQVSFRNSAGWCLNTKSNVLVYCQITISIITNIWVILLFFFFLWTGNYCAIELLEEASRFPSETPAPQSEDGNPPPKPTSAGAALKTSSFVFDRWYKMTKK